MARLEIIVDSGKAKQNVDDVTKSLGGLEAAGNRVDASTARTGSGIRSVGQEANNSIISIRNMAKEVATLAAGLYSLNQAKEVTLLAARYDQLGIVLNTVGKTTGYTRQEVEKYQASLQKTGISMIESRNTLLLMMQANIDLSKSSKLARIAQDAAVIGGINSSEAFKRMVTAIQQGDVLMLRNIGINANFEAAYQKAADALGTTTEKLSEYQKTQIRVQEVEKLGVTIQGTYESALGSASKMLTSTTRYLEDFKAKLGESNQPAFKVAVEGYSDALKFLSENAQGVVSVIEAGLIVATGRYALAIGQSVIATGRSIAATVADIAVKRTNAAQAVLLAEANLAEAASQTAATRVRFAAFASHTEISAAIARETLLTGELAVAQRVAAGTTTAFGVAARGAWTALLGPVGLVLAVGSLAAILINSGESLDQAKAKTDDLGDSYETARQKLEGLSDAQRDSTKLSVEKVIKGQKKALDDASHSYQKATNDAAYFFGVNGNTKQRDEVNKLQAALRAGSLTVGQVNAQLKQMGLPKDIINSITEYAAAWDTTNQKLLKSQELAGNVAKATADIGAAGGNEAARKKSQDDKTAQEQIASNHAEANKRIVDLDKQRALAGNNTALAEVNYDLAQLDKQGIAHDKADDERLRSAAKLKDSADAAAKSRDKQAADSKKIDDETENRNQSIKNSYLQFADTLNDPVQKAMAQHAKEIALIDKAYEGIAAKRNTIADTKVDFSFKASNGQNARVQYDNKNNDIQDVLFNRLDPQSKANALASYKDFLDARNALLQDKQAQDLKIDDDYRRYAKSISDTRLAQALDAIELSQDQKLASLTDFQLTERQKIEQQADFKLRQIKDQDSTTIDQMIKQAELEVAVMEKKAHDLEQVAIKQAQDIDNIMQGSKQAQAQENFDKSQQGLGAGAQGVNKSVFDIEQRRDAAIRAATQKGALAGDAGKDEMSDTIKALQANTDKEIEIARNTAAAKKAIQDDTLNSTSSMFDSLTSITADFAGKNSAAYRTMFAVQKAFNIARSLIAIQTGIAEAAANPFPLNLAAMASVAVATASIVSTITSVQPQGFAEGGYTGNGGKYEAAGIVHKGEVVWSQDDIRRAGGVGNVEAMRAQKFGYMNNHLADTTPQRMQSSNQTPQGQNPTIHIHNHGIDEAIEDWFKGSSSDKHFVNKFERNKSSMRMA